MDDNDVTMVLDNHWPAYAYIQELAGMASDAEELGGKIYDYLRELVPQNHGTLDLLWTQALGNIDFRQLGEYYWEDFGHDDDTDEEE